MKNFATALLLFAFIVMNAQTETMDIKTSSVTVDNLIEFIVNDFEYNIETGIKSNITLVVETKNYTISRDKKFFLKQAIHLMSKRLNSYDKISVISYNKNNGVVFKPISVSNKDGMLNKIMRFKVKKHNDLFGIDLAYSMAKEHYEDNGRNLVIIVRDGENFVAGLEIDTQNEGEGRVVKTGVVISALGLLPGLINAIKN
ncbi:MAG: hypothetical protein COA88_14745 [Kordia sp.]|nr:MAG: hypothetical protein COA88_14745 [Kordia sp.]